MQPGPVGPDDAQETLVTIADIKPGCYTEPPPAPDWYKLSLPDQPLKREWFCSVCQEYHEFADVPFEVQQ